MEKISVNSEDLIKRRDGLFYKKHAKIPFTGNAEEFWKNGKLKSSDSYQNGILHGPYEWHYENASHQTAQRELVWTIYLNDMPDGEAETEFLYQKRRIKPEQGMMCIFPAGLTHVHRGNTVFTQDKYILTGWALKVQ